MENNKNTKLTTPTAIIVAGFLVMLAILITQGGSRSNSSKEKSLSEQVGVKQEQFTQCMNEATTNENLKSLKDRTDASAELAMKNLPLDQRGTPYSVIIGKNGSKTEVRGAYTIDELKKLIAEVNDGKVTTPYKGEVPAVTAEDHIIGSPDAPIVVVEYSDLECPYCKRFGKVMNQLVSESNGQVAWVYRHWIVHQSALPKTAAAECVAKLKGNDAFWKYVDLTFAQMKTADDAPDTSNL